MTTYVVERRVVVEAPPASVWERVTTAEGINDELWPLLSMTLPPGLRGRSVADAGELVGRPLGKAWLRLFGLVPVDFDDMSIAALEPGRRFHEVSRMLALRRWEHERTLSAVEPRRCEVHDRLTFEVRGPLGRLGLAGAVASRVVGALFAHRHRRLARSFATG